VNGIAFGSGVGLACACDIAVASKSASFAVTEAKFGMLPATIGPYVINAVGKRQARRLALTAQPITGEVRELTVKTIGRVRGTDEAREGMAAFHEKRPAHWTKAVRA
jgi:methylglutaconyl-CoA hydratase